MLGVDPIFEETDAVDPAPVFVFETWKAGVKLLREGRGLFLQSKMDELEIVLIFNLIYPPSKSTSISLRAESPVGSETLA